MITERMNRPRSEIPSLLKKGGLIGIELGVASGDFSKRMIQSRLFSHFYGVDLYGDHHDTEEYKRALKNVGLQNNYTLLRMSFDEALDLFDDGYFDFVYVDGYAHSGENGGKTIYDWYAKVKINGIIAGHDYHPDWPAVVTAVNQFIDDAKIDRLFLTSLTQDPGPQDNYPSWMAKKITNFHPEHPAHLKELAKRKTKTPTKNNKVKKNRSLISKIYHKFSATIRGIIRWQTNS